MVDANMLDRPLNVLGVAGSLNQNASTTFVLQYVTSQLREQGCQVDVLDLSRESLGQFNVESSFQHPGYPAFKQRVDRADVYLLATPDYHGSISSATKNFLEHFWTEFAGKLFGSIVASYEKGLTVTDQIRTVARQCYAWSLPYGVAFMEDADVKDGKIIKETFQNRLDMMARDLRVYGSLLAGQREVDLAGSEPGFMARYRTS